MKNERNRQHCQGNWRHVIVAFGLSAAVLANLQAGVLHGQSVHQKDLMFAQVAAGPTIETTICVTNRGDAPYSGTLHFWRGQNQDWNPVVDGTPISDSQVGVLIAPGETRILKIEGASTLTAGAATLRADDLSQDNFVEGNLVYSVDSASYDNVGIAPSKELYLSVIPFEDMSAVGLAIANASSWQPAVARLRLFDAEGILKETAVRLLAERSHEAKFLSELFSSIVGVGKVEIESDRPISATAVTLVRGEISALPVLSSPIAYTFRTENGGEIDQAEVVLWSDGVFVEGYLRFLEVAGIPVAEPENFLVTGSLVNGVLRLTQFGAGPEIGGQETVNYLKIQGFTFGGEFWTGNYTRIMNGFPFYNIIEGKFDLVRK